MADVKAAKHTEGPWTLEGDPKIGYRIKIGPKHDIRDIVIVGRIWDRTAQAEDLANARLIKSSPALLAACKGLLALVLTRTDLVLTPEAMAAADAIAQAEDDSQPTNAPMDAMYCRKLPKFNTLCRKGFENQTATTAGNSRGD